MTALVTHNGQPAVLRDAIVDTPVGLMVALPHVPDDSGGAEYLHDVIVGDVLPVVEPGLKACPLADPTDCNGEHCDCPATWRRAGFVRVVEVLPVIHEDDAPFTDLPRVVVVADPMENGYIDVYWSDLRQCSTIDLPDAVPGGVVLVMEGVE
jgi:hypothetical protein